MSKTSQINHEDAQIIALKALAFLASDGDRISRFMGVTGLTPQEIRAQAAEPAFLGGVLEHLRSDQSLLLVFAESENIIPGLIDAASFRLSGTWP